MMIHQTRRCCMCITYCLNPKGCEIVQLDQEAISGILLVDAVLQHETTVLEILTEVHGLKRIIPLTIDTFR